MQGFWVKLSDSMKTHTLYKLVHLFFIKGFKEIK